MKEKIKLRRVCNGNAESLQKILAEYQNSGLTQRQYALKIGIGYSTLTKWLRLARGAKAPLKTAPVFVAVNVPPSMGSKPYHIELPGGIALQLEKGFDSQKSAGPKAAAIMSVIETCRRLSIDVSRYLKVVLPQLAQWPLPVVSSLTPLAWFKRQTK